MTDVSGFGLEIGPSYNPLLPKAEGYNVETLDYADQASLREKYSGTADVDIANIEPVDHVSDGRSMVDVVGKTACYDFIVASHVLEHTPDLIGFLDDCERLLKPSGTLLLAVPDKRCCFDVFQSLSSTGDALEAHYQRRERPGYGSIFDAIAYAATRNGQIGWRKEERDNRQIFQTLEEAYWISNDSRDSKIYSDVHVWRFVPASLELILRDLADGGEIDLRVQQIECTDEILVVLDRTGREATCTRIQLLEAILDQQAISSKNYGELTLLVQQDSLEELSKENKRISQILAERENQISDLRASTSWRLTYPLRNVVRKARSMMGRGKQGHHS